MVMALVLMMPIEHGCQTAETEVVVDVFMSTALGRWIGVAVMAGWLCACTGSDVSHPVPDSKPEPRVRLAVGGMYRFESNLFMVPIPCKFQSAEPTDAVEHEQWDENLILKPRSEGRAEVRCGLERIVIDLRAASRLTIEWAHDPGHADRVVVGDGLELKARFYDRGGAELMVGEFTNIEWLYTSHLKPDNSTWLGLSTTSYGLYKLKAIAPGPATVTARFGDSNVQLTVMVDPLTSAETGGVL